MAEYRPPVDDLQFLLSDVFKADAQWRSFPGMEDLDLETAEAIIGEAGKLCQQVIAPLNREADEQGCRWNQGEVLAPKGFAEAYQTYCEGGWGALGGNPKYEGMGMPKALMSGVEEMLQGSCMSFGLLPMLTSGATLAINAHASDELKSLYLPKMYSGEWSGVMDLTEPHAGTDLGLIRTKAEPLGDDSYAITGTKIFITWGEQSLTSNIVHLVLAKLPDAPEGSRGISLFLVPKYLPDNSAGLGDKNALSCGSIEKKMGIKASATCVMNFDGAKGWLVGEPNKGLACMFTMMNYERLVVGIQGLGTAEASYQAAVDYAKDRLQGRSVVGVQSSDKSADSILVHAEVRRMLLDMRVLNEGGRAFYTYVAMWLDQAKFSVDSEEKELAQNMVALLTPVAKAFLTDAALEAALQGQMVFGGHGYIREWGQEQFVRDIRITQIYEGTNGIQSMDLIGRKTVACKGKLLEFYLADIDSFIKQSESVVGAEEFSAQLLEEVARLKSVTIDVISRSSEDPNFMGAAATSYLGLIGYVSFAYMWYRMVVTVLQFEDGDRTALRQQKLKTARYYFDKTLTRTHSLEATIRNGAHSLMDFEESEF